MRFHCFGDEPKENESPKARDKVSTARHALGGKSFKHVVVFGQEIQRRAEKCEQNSPARDSWNGTWSDFTRDATTPLNGTFPYYSDGVVGESFGKGNYKATNGRLYKVSTSGTETPLAWYPAPGYRGIGEGALWRVGNRGYIWSSTSYDSGDHSRGMDLGFYATWLGSGAADDRAYGFQLRCLSE